MVSITRTIGPVIIWPPISNDNNITINVINRRRRVLFGSLSSGHRYPQVDSGQVDHLVPLRGTGQSRHQSGGQALAMG